MDSMDIKEIKKRYDLNKEDDILALYTAIQSGQIKLNSAAGRQLDDEVYEKAMEIKRLRTQRKLEQIMPKEESQPKKKSQKGKKVIVLTKGQANFRRFASFLLGILAFCCLGYFAWDVYNAVQAENESKKMAALKENTVVNDMYREQVVTKVDENTGSKQQFVVLDEYKSLYNRNKNLIGWLKIADTNIDYPVMQTGDNTFYLDHDINGQTDKNGMLFLDAACDITKPTTNMIVYGHNMRSGNMFGNLDKYKSEKYCKKHPIIMFDTIYEKRQYEVVFAFQSHIYNADEIAFKYYQFIDVTSEMEFDSNINSIREIAIYDTGLSVEYGDELITLSTCDYEEKDGRFVVIAKRIQ